MSSIDGFYNLVTDGTYFYTSNTYRNVVCRIRQDGFIKPDFIVVNNPICLEITKYTIPGKKQRLFVQSIKEIHVYEFTTPTTVTKITSIPFVSSLYFPSMFHHTVEDKLYISNYTTGTITTMNNIFVTAVTHTNLKGISGMVLASNQIYLSNYDSNGIFTFNNNIIQLYMNIPSPKGLSYSEGKFYVCYGTGDTKGIAVNIYGNPFFNDVFSDFIFNTVPLNTILFSNNLFITLENSNVIYRNKSFFCTVDFGRTIVYDLNTITPSVIATNEKCVSNPAFQPLIQLRTIGSNQNNPIPPVTTLLGRTQGNQIRFNFGLGSDYESLKMRRKAETLKFRNSKNNPGVTLTTKELYNHMVKFGGAYHFSKTRLNQLLKANNGALPCDIGINNGNPIVVTPPSNSGIHDSSFEGYYLNPYIPYYPSL
jgi:hypothetical protein